METLAQNLRAGIAQRGQHALEHKAPLAASSEICSDAAVAAQLLVGMTCRQKCNHEAILAGLQQHAHFLKSSGILSFHRMVMLGSGAAAGCTGMPG